MSEAIGYIYKTTNLINGKIYIGQHQNAYPDRDYFGSGKTLKKALKKYGKNNFIIEVLRWADSKEELDQMEIGFIKAYNSTNRNIGYNITNGGEGWGRGTHHTKETIIKMSKSQSNRIVSDETRKILSEAHKGIPSMRRGIPISEETKRKMSESLKGRNAWNKGLTGFMKGRKCSDETRKRISESSIGKPGMRNGIVLSDETKKRMSDSQKGKNKNKTPWNKGMKGIKWTEARRAAQNAKNIILFNNDSEKNQTNDSIAL